MIAGALCVFGLFLKRVFGLDRHSYEELRTYDLREFTHDSTLLLGYILYCYLGRYAVDVRRRATLAFFSTRDHGNGQSHCKRLNRQEGYEVGCAWLHGTGTDRSKGRVMSTNSTDRTMQTGNQQTQRSESQPHTSLEVVYCVCSMCTPLTGLAYVTESRGMVAKLGRAGVQVVSALNAGTARMVLDEKRMESPRRLSTEERCRPTMMMMKVG